MNALDRSFSMGSLITINLNNSLEKLLNALSNELQIEKHKSLIDSDADLFLSYKNGNEHAFRILFEKWKLPLISFFFRSIGNREQAEDLTLEVFHNLHKSSHRYQVKAKFSTYLFTLARRQLINHFRKISRKPIEIIDPTDFKWQRLADENDVQQTNEREEAMATALDRLPEKYRTPLLLQKQQGMNPRDIAPILKKSENSTRVILHRAKEQLKIILEEIT